MTFLLRDLFESDLVAGYVDGSLAEPGPGNRAVVDTDGIVSIDNGGLRITPPTTTGWGKHGLAYELDREPGLAVAFRFIDGDVQSGGTGTPHIAVGVCPDATPADPTAAGYFVQIDGNGWRGGRLWANFGAAKTSIFDSIKQVEMLLVVVLRATGAAYYITSAAGARNVGLAEWPNVRPIGISPAGSDTTVYASLWQNTLQSGGNNTRLFEATAKVVNAWSDWYGTAQTADDLRSSSGSISGRTTDTGQSWTLNSGTLTLDSDGAKATGAAIATLPCTDSVGLVKATVKTGVSPKAALIRFRAKDSSNYLWFGADASLVTLRKVVSGVETNIVQSGSWKLSANSTHVLQIIDDGNTIVCLFDGVRVATQSDSTLSEYNNIGVRFTTTADVWLQDIEAHARSVELPEELQLTPPYERAGDVVVATEDFTGTAGDLDGKQTTTGDRTWQKRGTGVLELDGSGKVIYDTLSGATAIYTVPWSQHEFVDLEVEHTPPGTGYGAGENAFGGLLFEQDSNNHLYLRSWIDDSQMNASEYEVILMIDGASYIVRRVNFGTQLAHGVTHTLRMSFDGNRFLAWLDGEPVISYALTDLDPNYAPLIINRVGLRVDNTNTGSKFDNFVARGAMASAQKSGLFRPIFGGVFV